jgi:formylglycine-generating enzyme required for sulfatase activity
MSERSDRTGSKTAGFLAIFIAVSLIVVGQIAVAGPNERPAEPAQTFRDCVDCPEMVRLSAGEFLMGSSASDSVRDVEAAMSTNSRAFVQTYIEFEQPQHRVRIDHSFAMGKYRVTSSEFAAFVRETGYSTVGGCTQWVNHTFPDQPAAGWERPGFAQTDRDPVVCVSWIDAKAYIAWLNSKVSGREIVETGGPYRLPSEAEWEFAARAGTQTARWWGDSVGSGNADCDGCGSRWDKQKTAPAGSFRTNAFGLSDVLGNAWEWTEDCWHENFAGAPGDGSAWVTDDCDSHAIRGGSWTNFPWLLRSAMRSKSILNRRGNYIGFRVAKSILETQP